MWERAVRSGPERAWALKEWPVWAHLSLRPVGRGVGGEAGSEGRGYL